MIHSVKYRRKNELNTKKIRFFCFVSLVYCTIFLLFRIKTKFYFQWMLFFYGYWVCVFFCLSSNDTNDLNTQWIVRKPNSNVPLGTTFESLLTTHANAVVTFRMVLIHSTNTSMCCYCCRRCRQCCCRSTLQLHIRINVCSVYIPIKIHSTDVCKTAFGCDCVVLACLLASANRFFFFFQPCVRLTC